MDVISNIIFSNIREITKIEYNKLFLVESQTKSKNKNSKVITARKRKNGKCFNCGTFGHYPYECRNKTKFRFKRNPRKGYSNNIPSTPKNIRNKHNNQVNAIEKSQDILKTIIPKMEYYKIVLQTYSAITTIHKTIYHNG